MKHLPGILAFILIAGLCYLYYDYQIAADRNKEEESIVGKIETFVADIIDTEDNKEEDIVYNPETGLAAKGNIVEERLNSLEKDMIDQGIVVNKDEIQRLKENASEAIGDVTDHAKKSFDERMQVEVNVLKKSAPLQIDPVTTLLDAKYENKKLYYYYELDFNQATGFTEGEEIEQEVLDNMAALIKKSNKAIVCKHTADVLRGGVTLVYMYQGKAKKNNMQYSINSGDCL